MKIEPEVNSGSILVIIRNLWGNMFLLLTILVMCAIIGSVA